MPKEFVKSQDIVVANIVFTPPEDNPRSTGQKIGYIRYKDFEDSRETAFKVLTPEIITETYGIPREGKYYPDAASRSFYKFPFAHDRRKYEGAVDYNTIEHFFNKLREIDHHCDTDAFRLQMFGEKQMNKYQYQPLVRVPEQDEGEVALDHNGNPYYNPPFTKIRLGLKYTTTYPDFLIFEKQNGLRRKVQLDTFDEVAKYINFLSRVRMVISFSKLYATKTSIGAEKKKYGIVLKATHVEVQPRRQMERISMDDDLFMDSEGEEEVHEH